MKSKIFFISCISLVLLFCFSSNVLGQEKIDLSIGFGMYELANVAVRYQIEQTQIGFSIGTLPWSDDQTLSILGDVYYHFGDYSNLSSRKPWYIRFGLTYLHRESIKEEKYYLIEDHFYLNSRFGREFNISKKIGLYVDLGANFEIKYNRKENYRESTEETCCQGGPQSFPVLPAVGIGMFYKF
ncbi:MAG: hypothetical protein GXO85_15310 [Chlorobi bacterium]|nr:hypothetical protein [Chlorobiota bacterium]